MEFTEESYPTVRTMVGNETERLLERDGKYRVVTVPMRTFAVLRPQKGPYLESAYFFARQVDDMLDGDYQPQDGFDQEAYIEAVVDGMDNGMTASTPSIVGLYEHAISFTKEDSLQREEMACNFRRLVSVMRFDFERHKSFLHGQPVLLSAEQLSEYYQETFEPALLITSQITGCDFEPEQIQVFGRTLGRMYSINDLEEDLARGLFNMPQEYICLPMSDGPAKLLDDTQIRQWAMTELEDGEKALRALKLEISRNADLKTKILFRLLAEGPLRYRSRLSRQWQI